MIIVSSLQHSNEKAVLALQRVVRRMPPRYYKAVVGIFVVQRGMPDLVCSNLRRRVGVDGMPVFVADGLHSVTVTAVTECSGCVGGERLNSAREDGHTVTPLIEVFGAHSTLLVNATCWQSKPI